MSRISAKTEQVYREGKMRRGQFTPKGKPKEVYKFWAKHAKHVPVTENFCHFWRVVVFWAPLMKLRVTALKMAEKPGTWIAVAIAYVLIFAGLTAGVDIAFSSALIAPYALAGLFVGAVSGVEGYDILNAEGDVDVRWLFWLSGLVSVPTFFIAKGLSSISDKTWKKIGIGVLGLAVTGFAVAGIVSLILGFMDNWQKMLLAIGIVAAGIVGVATLIFGFSYLYDHFTSKRKQAYADALDLYYEGKGPDPDEKPERERREPGKVLNFLIGIKDFLSLLFNVVRVNKWKICPIVTIDEK